MDRVRIIVNEVINYKREDRLQVATRDPFVYALSFLFLV